MSRQLESIAYGRPDYGGIVLGGENTGIYTLGDDWSDAADLESLVITASVWVHGDDDDEIQERVQLIEACLQDLGNLGITIGSLLTGTVDIAMVGDDLELTATAGFPFISAHLGLPINLIGVGAFQSTRKD